MQVISRWRWIVPNIKRTNRTLIVMRCILILHNFPMKSRRRRYQ